MSISPGQFRCSRCDEKIETWLTRRASFRCPACGQAFRSNYKSSLVKSVLLGVMIWLAGLLAGLYFADSWQRVLAVSIELGLFAAFFVAFFVHRRLQKIEPQ
ncbi:MAG: hypothetical protein ABW072_04145 [Sedimenticola sp.]